MPGTRLTAPSYVRSLLDAYGIRIKKRLGQNFLIDQNILNKIVEAADVAREDTVIEIGPGIGALTQALGARGARVIAIEIDDDLIPVLTEVFHDVPNVKIVHADALKIDLAALVPEIGEIKVVANLPYYITSPLIMRFLESPLPLERMVVMVQAEVAQRLAAEPGSKAYGSLSIAVQYRAEVTRITRAPRTVFLPQPNVDSAVVSLRLRAHPVQAKDDALFNAVVRAAFEQRRKMLRGALQSFAGERGLAIEEVLRQADVDPHVRGESLSIEHFVAISDVITNMVQ